MHAGGEGSLQAQRDRAFLMPQTIHRSYTSSMFVKGGEGPHEAEPDRAFLTPQTIHRSFTS